MTIERKTVDTREYSNGMHRMRFRLSDAAYDIVQQALSLSPYEHLGASLDAIAMNALTGPLAVLKDGIPAVGRNRWVVTMFPDQYECVRHALDDAGEFPTDADALVLICLMFIRDQSEISCNVKTVKQISS